LTGYGRDAFQPGYTGNENDSDPVHLPYVRHVHLGWRHDQYGRWVSDQEDEAQWEVVCIQCGDDEGPADRQTPGVQRLRGPYPSRHKARHAAGRHEAETNAPTRWIPGSAVPLPEGGAR